MAVGAIKNPAYIHNPLQTHCIRILLNTSNETDIGDLILYDEEALVSFYVQI